MKENDINGYVMRNMNRMEHISHLIIDLYALVDTDNELIKTVETIHRVYEDMQVIVLADMVGNRDKNFFKRLIENQVYNIMQSSLDDKEPFEQEFLHCVHEGKTREEALLLCEVEQTKEKAVLVDENLDVPAVKQDVALSEEIKKQHDNRLLRERLSPNRSFKEYKDYLIVSVAGVNNHVGTTHNALLIAKFLKDVGFKVCYLENGRLNKISSLKDYIPTINYNERTGQMQLNRIDLYAGVSVNELLPYEYDIYVVDVGVLAQETLMSFLYKDVHVLVCGGKAWEISDLPQAVNLIKAKNAFHVLFNFALKEDETKILSMIGELKKQAYFAEYVPHFLEGDVNVRMYQSIFEKYLTVDEPVCDKPIVVKRKSGFLNLMSRK